MRARRGSRDTWGAARKQDAYQAPGTSPAAVELHRDLNTRKQTDLPWLSQVSTGAPQEALRTVDQAFAHCSRGRRGPLQRAGQLRGKVGSPRPTTKQRGRGSFRLSGRLVVEAHAMQLPRLRRLGRL